MKKLILEFIKSKGRKPNAIEMLKLKARFRDQSKILQFPKDRITNWWEPRPGDKTPIKKETTLDDLLKGKSHIDERGREWTFKKRTEGEVFPIQKGISDEAATAQVQKLKEDLPSMSLKELHQLRADVINRKAYGFFNDAQRRELLDALTNQFTNKSGFAAGGIAGQLHLNEGGRAGFKEGSGMKRRTFLKILGGLGALPIVGKYFKLAKPAATVASKTPMVAQSPEFLGTLIEVLRAKGIEKITKLGNKITEYKGVVLEEQPGRIEVYRKGKKKEGYHEVLEGTEEVKDEGLETAKIIQGEDEYFGKVSKKGDEDLIEIADEIKGMVPDADEWIQPVRFTKSINPRLQAHHDYWDDIDKKAKTMKDYASGGLVDLLSL